MNDADADSTNEIQDLQLNGNILKITRNGSSTSIDLSKYLDDKDTQQMTIKNDTIVLQRGGFVKLPVVKTNDADSAIGNEILNIGTGYGVITRSGSGTSADPYKVDFIQGLLNKQILVWDSINNVWQLGVVTTSGVFTETDAIIGNEIKDVGTGNGILSRSGSGTTGNPYKIDINSGTVAGQVWRWNGSVWTTDMPADTSATNELQTLSISNDTLFLSGGGSVKLKSGSGSFWSTTGNSGLVDSISFIGTTDSTPLRFRVNNRWVGEINDTNYNISLGLNSNLKSNGSHNIAIGKGSMGEIASQRSNLIAIGDSTLYNNGKATGTYIGSNTAIGSKSLYSNTNGLANTAIGFNSLYSNISGNANVAIGDYSLYSNTTNGANTAIGVSALKFNTGPQNTAIGSDALSANTTGGANTALGSRSLFLNSIGFCNAAIGESSMVNNRTGIHNTALGYSSLATNNSGSYNTAIGDSALYSNTTNSNCIGIGFRAVPPSSSNQVRIGNTAITYAGVQVSWTVTSDIYWKKGIQNSDLGLDFITKLRPVSFIRKNDESQKLEYGFIAQELDAALRSSGVVNDGIISTDAEGKLGVRYNDLLAPMVKAIQELKSENEALKNRLQLLETQVNTPKR